MADFSLRIASEDVQVLDLGQPLGLLSLVCKVLDRHTEHGNSESNSWEQALEIPDPVDVGWADEAVFKADFFVGLVEGVDPLPEVLLHLVRSHIIESRMVTERWVSTELINDLRPFLLALCATMKERSQLRLIESTLLSLFEQIWCYNSLLNASCFTTHLIFLL